MSHSLLFSLSIIAVERRESAFVGDRGWQGRVGARGADDGRRPDAHHPQPGGHRRRRAQRSHQSRMLQGQGETHGEATGNDA